MKASPILTLQRSLKAELARQGLTQTDLAWMTGKHASSISRSLNHHNPKMGTLCDCAAALGCHFELVRDHF